MVFTAISYTLARSLTNNGDNGGGTAASNTPNLVHGVGTGPEALGGGDSTDGLEDENLGKMLPSRSVAAILIGDGAEHVQINGPHAQMLMQAGGHLGTLFPS